MAIALQIADQALGGPDDADRISERLALPVEDIKIASEIIFQLVHGDKPKPIYDTHNDPMIIRQ